MADNRTRTGFGKFGEGTQVSNARIQVRMSSGKIYGPYTRGEILAFIQQRKLKGEEEILVEGESSWKIISSDVEFFDLFQKILEKSGTKSESSAIKKEETVAGYFKESEKKKSRLSVEKASPKKKEVVPDPVFNPGTENVQNPTEERASIDHSFVLGSPQRRDANRGRNLKIAGAIFLLVVLISFFFQNKSAKTPQNFSRFSSPILYAKPLEAAMEEMPPRFPEMPMKVNAEESWSLMETFHAVAWAERIKKLAHEEDLQIRSRASYWGDLAWCAMWLGTTVTVFDEDLGRAYYNKGQEIFSELKSRKLVPEGYSDLFKSISLLSEGSWTEARMLLTPLTSKISMARWLSQEAQWENFWAENAKGEKPGDSGEEYANPSLELSSKLRAHLFSADDSFFDWAQQMASIDPQSSNLWLASAERYWRMSRDGVVMGNRLFLTGLATLSLVPPSFQQVYWSQYLGFLNAYGRQVNAKKAFSNARLIATGDIAKLKNFGGWWDFDKEGLELSKIMEKVLEPTRVSLLSSLDVATLQVLSRALPRGAEAMVAVGYSRAFEGSWSKAAHLFSDALKIDRTNTQALGGLIWSYSSQYKFDKAFETHDKLLSVAGQSAEPQKYMAVIQLLGREYSEAATALRDYLKGTPNDGVAHYFLALTYLAQEKNVDCMKSANLALSHSRGEFNLRSKLLFYRCRVLGGVGVKQALEELQALSVREPNNIPVKIEVLKAFAATDLMDKAIQLGRDFVGRFPRSYELRMELASLYRRAKDADKALAFYSRAKEDRPDAAEASVQIGKIFEEQGKFLEAAQNFDTAARIEPEYPEVWLFSARAYAEAGRAQEAANMYVREIEERPAVVGTFLEAAEFFLKINAPQEIPKIFLKFKADFQDDPRVQTRMAQAYFAMGDTDRARSAAATAIAGNAKIAEPHRILAYILDEQGQYSSAKGYFEKYLSLLPQAADAEQIRAKISRPPY